MDEDGALVAEEATEDEEEEEHEVATRASKLLSSRPKPRERKMVTG